MTEIQFLIDLILNGKLSASAKEKCVARIGEVEASLTKMNPKPIPQQPIIQTTTQQAPSMQRIIDEVAMTPTPAPKRIVVPTEVITSTGNGTSTRGPRKF